MVILRFLFYSFVIISLFLLGCTKQQKLIDNKIEAPKVIEQYKTVANTSETGANISSEQINTSKTKTDLINNTNSTNSAVDAKTQLPPTKPAPKIINGKILEERLKEANDRLHTQGSGQQIRNDFTDIKLVYTDNAQGTGFPETILPFRYYYSEEANKTFNICNIDFTVFICNGKLSRLISKEDIDSKRCEATFIYLNDPRLGGNGEQSYGHN